MRKGLANSLLTGDIENKKQRKVVIDLKNLSKWMDNQIPHRQKGIVKEQILLWAEKAVESHD